MAKLIINSDDFGYSRGTNYGIVDSHQQGVLSSTTLMANMPGFEHALELLNKHHKLGIGVHLSLTCGQPVLSTVTNLLQENGQFKPLKTLKEAPLAVDLDQLYAEWQAQIEKVQSAGVAITHLDSHHYTHSYGKNYQVIEALAQKYQLPLRNCFGVKEKLTQPELAPATGFWNLFNYPEMKVLVRPYSEVKESLFEIVRRDAETYAQHEVVEAVCHPGYVDTTVLLGSSFNVARTREVEMLCDPEFRELLQEFNYEICRYDEL